MPIPAAAIPSAMWVAVVSLPRRTTVARERWARTATDVMALRCAMAEPGEIGRLPAAAYAGERGARPGIVVEQAELVQPVEHAVELGCEREQLVAAGHAVEVQQGRGGVVAEPVDDHGRLRVDADLHGAATTAQQREPEAGEREVSAHAAKPATPRLCTTRALHTCPALARVARQRRVS